jgi:glucose/arabinose dehydrogenase
VSPDPAGGGEEGGDDSSPPPQADAASSDRTTKVRDNRAIVPGKRADDNAPLKSLYVAALLALLTAAASSQSATGVHSIPFASGLQAPVGFVADPTDRTVFYAIEQAGRIRIIRDRAIVGDLLDFRGAIASGGERGMLGLAFAPNFATSGRFFVNFTNLNGHTVVARFRKIPGGGADLTSRFDLRFNDPDASDPAVIFQPFANHNAGNLAFGPDGLLFICLGDGGSANDPDNRAQDLSKLLGKTLRVDVNVPDNHPTGYELPADNPFINAGPPVRREIWNLGLRNPWRYSFDDVALGGTGALVIGDVGQNAFEEIDYEPRGRGGRNYGWVRREGAHDTPGVPPRPLGPGALLDPIHDYGRSLGASVTGGFVYRGRSLGNEYRGRYFFADYVSGRVWSLGLTLDSNGEARVTGVIEHTTELGGPSVLGNISSFGVDLDGELYIVSHTRGVVLRLVGELPTPQNLRIIR